MVIMSGAGYGSYFGAGYGYYVRSRIIYIAEHEIKGSG
jgi:hypothetical protein